MNNLEVAIIQTFLYWEDKIANLAMLEEKIREVKSKVDIIVLPEMFNSGFSMNTPVVAEPVQGHTTKWMKFMAQQSQAAIAGSIAIQENGVFYNRFLFVTPDGLVQHYDKIHLFSTYEEDKHYTKGNNIKIINYKKWKINLQICYDLRFPETSRNDIKNNEYLYDLLLYTASWPQTRIASWNCLLQARAIENACYVIGVNRTGTDHKELEFNGNSAICFFDPEKNINFENKNDIFLVSLNADLLLHQRKIFPFLKDKIDR